MGKHSDTILSLLFGVIILENRKLRKENKELLKHDQVKRVLRYGRYVPKRNFESNIIPSSTEYLFPTLEGARDVLSDLRDWADKYGTVSVGDYLIMIDENNKAKFTDYDWGWSSEDLTKACIFCGYHGATLVLPEPHKI